MLLELYSVLNVAGQTLLKLVPVTLALGVVFALLEQWSACNPGRPWWNKREIVSRVNKVMEKLSSPTSPTGS